MTKEELKKEIEDIDVQISIQKANEHTAINTAKKAIITAKAEAKDAIYWLNKRRKLALDQQQTTNENVKK